MSENNNPLLAKVKLPGRIFQLPSRGALYSNELQSAIRDGEIHVHQMSAMDEIVLKNPDMLFSGAAISAVFKSCVPDIAVPEELFGRDIDAVMIFLRLVTYGSSYEIISIHNCEGAKEHNYIVDLETMLSQTEYLDPTTIESDYKVVMDNGQVVFIQPIRYSHLIELLKLNENKKKLTPEDIQQNLVINLLNIIKSVDGIDDKEMITAWLRAIPAPFISKISSAIEATNKWGPKLTSKVKCKDCGEEYEIDIPINPISFFTE